MSAIKSSTLPAVLKEYLPDYEPRPSQAIRDVGSCEDEAERTSDSLHDGAHQATPASAHKKTKSSARTRDAPPPSRARNRERSFVLQRKQEAVRYHRNYDDWQNIKQEFRDEKKEKFQHKVALQKEIIRRRDELHRLRLQNEAEEADKRRQEARGARQAQNAALVEVCRQSLDEDRQRHAERLAIRQARQRTPDESPERKTILKPLGERQLTYISERSVHSSLASVPIAGSPPTPPLVAGYSSHVEEHDEFTISEEEEEEEDGDTEAGPAVPWHHDQLYRLYGKHADYFLHPKIEQEKKTFDKPMNPKLRKQGGRAGAGVLWNTLRNDSRMKLLEEDASIPSELKSAYSAFVRQLLTRRRRPVKRNYCCEEDVPEMDRLLDQSRLHAAHQYKHKVELMYRSSVNNDDRTAVLVYNEPLPNLNNWTGEESVARYMPSWLDPQDDQSSVASYQKWLALKSNAELTLPAVGEERPAEEWSFLRSSHTRKPEPKARDKIHFLTEKESSVPGEFSKRRKEMLEARHLPQAFSGGEGPGAGQATASQTPPQTGVAVGQKTPPSSTQRVDWQPLSLNALAEYKKEKLIQGEGRFQHGAAPVWPAQS